MWNIEDKNGFESKCKQNEGQININQNFGKIIFELSKCLTNNIFVDIGTWNGLGSTKCFIEGMLLNKKSVLYTIENNKEKYEYAKNYWKDVVIENNLNVNFLNGSLIGNDSINNWLVGNDIILEKDQEYWLSIDKKNSSNIISLNIDRIDVLLIDGSDYSGYLELMLLKNISNYILLDDVNGLKNKMSRDFMLKSEDFELIKEDLSDRNGYSVFKNIKI